MDLHFAKSKDQFSKTNKQTKLKPQRSVLHLTLFDLLAAFDTVNYFLSLNASYIFF